ncbi:hypothetical protein ACJX0J_042425, partial [Zea mays]
SAFIPFITASDPDLATTSKALKILNSCGSDVIEVGVPYSDPLANGPVIQASVTRALKKGTKLNSLSCPIVLFTYYNPILKRGVGNFMSIIKQAGRHGLVVLNLPLEETTLLRSEAIMHNIELVHTHSHLCMHHLHKVCAAHNANPPTDRMKGIAQASEMDCAKNTKQQQHPLLHNVHQQEHQCQSHPILVSSKIVLNITSPPNPR